MNEEKIREGFEDWYSGGNPACVSLERYGDGYALLQANYAWSAWRDGFEHGFEHGFREGGNIDR